MLAEVEALEHRARRRDLLADDQTLFRFFDERVPEDVVSGRHFDRWWRDQRRRHPELLLYPREVLIDPTAAAALDQRAFPDRWKQGDLVFALSYHFEPGERTTA